MHSSFVYYCNNIIKIGLGVLIVTSFSCSHRMASTIDVSPKNFKIQIPFIINESGIIINTYWGSLKKHYVLCLDNNSPSWIKRSVVHYDQSFVKSRNLGFKTSTADGSHIQGEVGICDSVFFENIAFRNIPFYVMPDNSKDNKTDDGVLGIDAMSKGIWKIDFKKEKLTFASDIDSFQEVKQSEIFPATFNKGSVMVDVNFGNHNKKAMAIDLGYNGYMLVPMNELKSIISSDRIFTTEGKFTTPAGESNVNNLSAIDTVEINQNWFFAFVSSNDLVKERLIGLKFFRRFEYVIFDFVNKLIYIPKKVW